MPQTGALPEVYACALKVFQPRFLAPYDGRKKANTLSGSVLVGLARLLVKFI
jgi:hypothetical protein